MKRPCLGPGCPRLIPSGSYCKRCARTSPRQTKGRGSGWQATAFRKETLRLAGYRCQRCGLDQRQLAKLGRTLQAHHRVKLRDGGSNDAARNGEALCTGSGGCHAVAELE